MKRFGGTFYVRPKLQLAIIGEPFSLPMRP